MIYLRALFRYEPDTGRLYWRPRYDAPAGWNARYAGRRAGYVRCGRQRVGLPNGTEHATARIIWKLLHGREPMVVDHVNGNPLDDRAVNLRAATLTQNAHNRRGFSGSGFKGVGYCRARKKWTARIQVQGKPIDLGRFEDPREAHAAYMRAAEKNFGAFARGDWKRRRRR